MRVDEKYDYVLVGSGPSAFAAISRLPTGVKVLVIDRGIEKPKGVRKAQENFLSVYPAKINKLNAKATESKRKSSFDVKKYWGSDFVYNVDFSTVPAESQSKGGFTNVWGATCFPATKELTRRFTRECQVAYMEHVSILEKALNVSWAQENSNCYPPCATKNTFLNERNSFLSHLGRAGDISDGSFELSWEQTRLAVSAPGKHGTSVQKSDCINCGLCQTGCPIGFTWNSWFNFEKEMNRLSCEYLVGNVETIEEFQSETWVTFTHEKQKAKVKSRRVLLTGGVLSSSRILLNSGKIMETSIHDSQTIAFAGFSPKRRVINSKLSNVSFPEMSFLFRNSKNDIAFQIYSFNQYIAERASPLFAKTLFKNKSVQSFLQRFFFVGLGYFDSNLSGQITVKRHGLKVSKGKAKLRSSLYKDSRKKLKLISLYLSPIFKSLKVGGGYHFMGNFFPDGIWKDEEYLTGMGMMKLTALASFSEDSNIHLVDGSIQGHLPTGSVTLNSMAITSLVVDRIVLSDRNFKSQLANV